VVPWIELAVFGITYAATGSLAWAIVAAVVVFELLVLWGIRRSARMERMLLSNSRDFFIFAWSQFDVPIKISIARRLLGLSMAQRVTPAMAEEFAIMFAYILPPERAPLPTTPLNCAWRFTNASSSLSCVRRSAFTRYRATALTLI
jgi:hypothetical protein